MALAPLLVDPLLDVIEDSYSWRREKTCSIATNAVRGSIENKDSIATHIAELAVLLSGSESFL